MFSKPFSFAYFSRIIFCDVYIESFASGIANYNGKVEVNGGRLIIKSEQYSAISAAKVDLKDLVIDIQTKGDECSLIYMTDADEFNIPGNLRFYDIDGGIVCEGDWQSSYIVDVQGMKYIFIGDKRICRIATKHEHTYGDWSSDADNHWHQCTNGYCDDLVGSVKDKAAHTGADDGDCTTPVLCDVCGYVIKAAEKSHRYGEWKDNGNGTRVRYCTNDGCKASQTEKYIVNKEDEKHYTKSPKTGEAESMAVTVTLIVSGITLLAGVAFLGGKKINNK